MALLLLDNHDSFTWNLVELLRRTSKVKVNIVTPEKVSIPGLEMWDRIIFSPGPGLPHEQPVMFSILEAVERMFYNGIKKIPLFGVCLGMQAIAIQSGGSLYNLPAVVHGQPRKLKILQAGHPLFKGIQDGCEIGLYHSWAVDPATLPGCLETLAVTGDGTIMALSHKILPFTGVQFHPESFMTPAGEEMMANWLDNSV
ncbi:MAG: aminodeoxychorismate/anthranilate synthase component II [Bacteroidota bacterium]